MSSAPTPIHKPTTATRFPDNKSGTTRHETATAQVPAASNSTQSAADSFAVTTPIPGDAIENGSKRHATAATQVSTTSNSTQSTPARIVTQVPEVHFPVGICPGEATAYRAGAAFTVVSSTSACRLHFRSLCCQEWPYRCARRCATNTPSSETTCGEPCPFRASHDEHEGRKAATGSCGGKAVSV